MTMPGISLNLTNGQIVLSLVAVSLTYYLIVRWNPRYFRKLGINGPFPIPFLGNMWPIIRKGVVDTDMQNAKTFGRTWGVFEGAIPMIQTIDPDIIREVMVKDFNNFVNRRTVRTDDPLVDNFLTALRDDHWRHVRHFMSPAFSTGKLKLMTYDMNVCAKILVENLTNLCKQNTNIEIRDQCGDFTMDVIARTAFGVEIDTQKNPNSPFVHYAKKLFAINMARPAILLYFMFPPLRPLLRKLKVEMLPHDTLEFFRMAVSDVIEGRKGDTDSNRTDFLQMMLKAQDHGADVYEQHQQDTGTDQSDWKKKGLSKEEVLAQSMLFFLAGYETTASTLAFLAYCFALNPDYQDRAHAEVVKDLGNKVDVDFDTAHHKLTYLEQCLDETLRLYPAATRTDRQAKQDVTVCGVNVPKDVYVSMQIYALHHDPQFWAEPEKFDPERFSAEGKAKQHPFQYIPFGHGPRMCIGMRLAQLEVKVAMAHLLRNFRFVTCPETEVPIKFKKKNLLQPLNGIKLKLEPRLL